MDRRDFLTAGKAKKAIPAQPIAFASSPTRTQSGINPYTGPWTTNEVIHLLKRTLFGATKTDVDFFKTMTMSQAVDALLNVPVAQFTPPPPVKNYADSTNPNDPDNAVAAGQTWVNTNTNDGLINTQRLLGFKNWWMGQLITQDRNILEKMTLFWHNHFATEMDV
ncbi:MAG: DUF1800 family protein, partial [Ferruginibacter sp.]